MLCREGGLAGYVERRWVLGEGGLFNFLETLAAYLKGGQLAQA